MIEQINAKTLRERLDWTQEQLAEYLGLDRSSVSRLERGQDEGRAPKGSIQKLLRNLAVERGVDLDSIEITPDPQSQVPGATA